MKPLKLIFVLATVFVFNTFVIANTSVLTLKVIELKAKSEDSCNEKMDFYAKAYINQQFRGKRGVKEGNYIRPNWRFQSKVSSNRMTLVELEVWDEDDTWCGGGDDRVDISNYLSETLKLFVNNRTLKIYDEKKKYVGKTGEVLTFIGSSYGNSPASGDNIETGMVKIVIDVVHPSLVKRLGVEILSLRARSKDSCNGKMDFYSKIRINSDEMKESRVKEGNYIRPMWKNFQDVDVNKGTAVVRIEIWDNDDAACGGRDDKVDVNPNEDKFIQLFIDMKTGKMYSDAWKRKYLGRVNQTLETEGNAHRTYSVFNLNKRNLEAATMQYKITLR